MSCRLGVAVGGKFTDVLLIDEETGRMGRSKNASTTPDRRVGVVRGVQKASGIAGIGRSQIAEVPHGTTVAPNAILQEDGAKVGLVTAQAFRQIRPLVPGAAGELRAATRADRPAELPPFDMGPPPALDANGLPAPTAPQPL